MAYRYEGFDLSGKVALVTGGNGGIGLGMAEAMAEAGADIAIWGTNAKKNEAALKAVDAAGDGSVATFTCDVSDSAAVDRVMDETVERFGRIDGAFVNAGVTGDKKTRSVLDISDEEFRRVVGINLDGAFWTLRAAARHMVARAEKGDPGGRLVGTASLAALSGASRNEHYAATKGGLVSMLRAMATELARYDITANSVLPGWIETEMTEASFNWDKFRDNVDRAAPLPTTVLPAPERLDPRDRNAEAPEGNTAPRRVRPEPDERSAVRLGARSLHADRHRALSPDRGGRNRSRLESSRRGHPDEAGAVFENHDSVGMVLGDGPEPELSADEVEITRE